MVIAAGDEVKYEHLLLPTTLRTRVCHDVDQAAVLMREKEGNHTSHVHHERDIDVAPRAADGAC